MSDFIINGMLIGAIGGLLFDLNKKGKLSKIVACSIFVISTASVIFLGNYYVYGNILGSKDTEKKENVVRKVIPLPNQQNLSGLTSTRSHESNNTGDKTTKMQSTESVNAFCSGENIEESFNEMKDLYVARGGDATKLTNYLRANPNVRLADINRNLCVQGYNDHKAGNTNGIAKLEKEYRKRLSLANTSASKAEADGFKVGIGAYTRGYEFYNTAPQ
jgi:hypothetical protein